jgi:hypothetical protein
VTVHLATTSTLSQSRLAALGCQHVRGVLVYCADYRCSHSVALNADRWADEVRLSDIEPRFVCAACGKRGAEVRPDFNWNRSTE